ncbi:hypothetical protein [Phycicoccus sp.]|uniref:hypothetical protein n=1 Tax=Phycicoccus sp. TaxID=1902410 RepID=UPI002C192810|nr:hypothetical protein [Phycicoccus sp.]HMM94396.1 hypothetical protein [Phycicoccus sp.]
MHFDAIRTEIRGTTSEDGLLFLYEAGGESSHTDFAAALGVREHQAVEVQRHLDRLGVIGEESDNESLCLNLRGTHVAESVVRSRASGPDRRDAVQRAFLQWLADGVEPGRPVDFHGQPTATAFGTAFTVEEIKHAAQFLLDHGLIQGFQSMAGLQGPTMTYEGGYALHHSGLIVDFLKRGGSTTYDNSNTTHIGDGNTIGGIQTGGHDNTLTVNLSVAQRAQVLGLVGGLLRTLDEAGVDAADLRTAVEAIQKEAASEGATPGSLKKRIFQALVLAGASEAGHLISQGLAQLLGTVTD